MHGNRNKKCFYRPLFLSTLSIKIARASWSILFACEVLYQRRLLGNLLDRGSGRLASNNLLAYYDLFARQRPYSCSSNNERWVYESRDPRARMVPILQILTQLRWSGLGWKNGSVSIPQISRMWATGTAPPSSLPTVFHVIYRHMWPRITEAWIWSMTKPGISLFLPPGAKLTLYCGGLKYDHRRRQPPELSPSSGSSAAEKRVSVDSSFWMNGSINSLFMI